MRSHYDIIVHTITNINEPSFLTTLRTHHIDAGISLRCYQRFRPDIINFFSQSRLSLKLHPDVLPQYRGVMTDVRAIVNGERGFEYSLHYINGD